MLTNLFLTILNREASSPKRGAQRIIESLHLTEGKTVADIGSGGGYFSLLFAQKVGKGGKVYAVDNKPDHLDFVKRQAEKAGLSNIVSVEAGNEAVALPEATLDLIFSRNVFHHLTDPEGYFRSLKRALKPEGIVVVIDHVPSRGFGFVNIFKHFTPVGVIHKAMESAGYQLSNSFDFLPAQSFTMWSCIGETP
jgi:arsenite methyltransferase